MPAPSSACRGGSAPSCASLRALTLLLLVACLLRPVRVMPPDSTSDVVVPVLVDVSRSMGLADMDGRTRIDAAREMLERQVRPALARRFVPEVWTFGDTLEQADGASLARDRRPQRPVGRAARAARPLPRPQGCGGRRHVRRRRHGRAGRRGLASMPAPLRSMRSALARRGSPPISRCSMSRPAKWR